MKCLCCNSETEEVQPSVHWCRTCHWWHYEVAPEAVTVARLAEHVIDCQFTTWKELVQKVKGEVA